MRVYFPWEIDIGYVKFLCEGEGGGGGGEGGGGGGDSGGGSSGGDSGSSDAGSGSGDQGGSSGESGSAAGESGAAGFGGADTGGFGGATAGDFGGPADTGGFGGAADTGGFGSAADTSGFGGAGFGSDFGAASDVGSFSADFGAPSADFGLSDFGTPSDFGVPGSTPEEESTPAPEEDPGRAPAPAEPDPEEDPFGLSLAFSAVPGKAASPAERALGSVTNPASPNFGSPLSFEQQSALMGQHAVAAAQNFGPQSEFAAAFPTDIATVAALATLGSPPPGISTNAAVAFGSPISPLPHETQASNDFMQAPGAQGDFMQAPGAPGTEQIGDIAGGGFPSGDLANIQIAQAESTGTQPGGEPTLDQPLFIEGKPAISTEPTGPQPTGTMPEGQQPSDTPGDPAPETGNFFAAGPSDSELNVSSLGGALSDTAAQSFGMGDNTQLAMADTGITSDAGVGGVGSQQFAGASGEDISPITPSEREASAKETAAASGEPIQLEPVTVSATEETPVTGGQEGQSDEEGAKQATDNASNTSPEKQESDRQAAESTPAAEAEKAVASQDHPTEAPESDLAIQLGTQDIGNIPGGQQEQMKDEQALPEGLPADEDQTDEEARAFGIIPEAEARTRHGGLREGQIVHTPFGDLPQFPNTFGESREHISDRLNNPGGMSALPEAAKFGATGYERVQATRGEQNTAAQFPTMQQGIASMFQHMADRGRDRSADAYITGYSGNNRTATQNNPLPPGTQVNAALANNSALSVPFALAITHDELHNDRVTPEMVQQGWELYNQVSNQGISLGQALVNLNLVAPGITQTAATQAQIQSATQQAQERAPDILPITPAAQVEAPPMQLADTGMFGGEDHIAASETGQGMMGGEDRIPTGTESGAILQPGEEGPASGGWSINAGGFEPGQSLMAGQEAPGSDPFVNTDFENPSADVMGEIAAAPAPLPGDEVARNIYGERAGPNLPSWEQMLQSINIPASTGIPPPAEVENAPLQEVTPWSPNSLQEAQNRSEIDFGFPGAVGAISDQAMAESVGAGWPDIPHVDQEQIRGEELPEPMGALSGPIETQNMLPAPWETATRPGVMGAQDAQTEEIGSMAPPGTYPEAQPETAHGEAIEPGMRPGGEQALQDFAEKQADALLAGVKEGTFPGSPISITAGQGLTQHSTMAEIIRATPSDKLGGKTAQETIDQMNQFLGKSEDGRNAADRTWAEFQQWAPKTSAYMAANKPEAVAALNSLPASIPPTVTGVPAGPATAAPGWGQGVFGGTQGQFPNEEPPSQDESLPITEARTGIPGAGTWSAPGWGQSPNTAPNAAPAMPDLPTQPIEPMTPADMFSTQNMMPFPPMGWEPPPTEALPHGGYQPPGQATPPPGWPGSPGTPPTGGWPGSPAPPAPLAETAPAAVVGGIPLSTEQIMADISYGSGVLGQEALQQIRLKASHGDPTAQVQLNQIEQGLSFR